LAETSASLRALVARFRLEVEAPVVPAAAQRRLETLRDRLQASISGHRGQVTGMNLDHLSCLGWNPHL
jgi:hypothetical protein